eukprot:TRINITY_DN5967_c0_g1_i2.p1 TRINITY_DN5967_c0_g1~~TRINITY_DN5967_c0_g1_i2.p1  ORF type:complete len:267 (-),score=24.73 TRINITY_DN5967_c0_g1_i2:117-917(-)
MNQISPTNLLGNFTEYQFSQLVLDSTVINNQISLVAIFISIFYYTLIQSITTPVLVGSTSIVTIVGYIFSVISGSSLSGNNLKANVRSMIILLISIWGLSPVLRSLTAPISEDTIIVLTLLFFAVHLYFQDYGYLIGLSEKYFAPVSLNAAIFASVCLVSRLPSTVHVFAIMFLAIEIFALSPMLRHHLKKYSYWLDKVSSLILFASSIYLLKNISLVFTWMYVLSVSFISVICPICLVYMQRYKNILHGPWDEAIPSREKVFFKE